MRASAAPCPRAPPLIRTTLLSKRAMVFLPLLAHHSAFRGA
jgi:hypothetical protein